MATRGKNGGGKTGGRKKGSRNAFTKTAKEAIEFAASKMGGGARLHEWVPTSEENEKLFWSSIYPKLLPLQTQISGVDGGPLETVNRVEIVPVTPTPKKR